MSLVAVAPMQPLMELSGIHDGQPKGDIDDTVGPNIMGGKTDSNTHPLATRRRSLWEE